MISSELASFDRRKGSVIALSFLPPVAVGLALERQIEENLGGPFQTAIGLLVGAAAMALADQRPKHRSRARAGALDGLSLGVAQACALAPGVSRNGATLTAARWRGFGRAHANMLSRTVALPVIVSAAVLKAARLRRRGLPPEHRAAFVAGTATSFVSTLASQALIGLVERDSALWPYSAYRAGLAGIVLAQLRRKRKQERELVAATVAFGNGHGDADTGRDAARAAEQVARTQEDGP